MPTAENTEVQNGYNQVFVDAVRATGGRNRLRTLIVQTYVANASFGADLFQMPVDPTPGRLMVKVHYYDPTAYCFDGHPKVWGKKFEDKHTPFHLREAAMDSTFARLKKRFVDAGYPVALGEFGAARWKGDSPKETKAIEEARCHYYERIISTARHNGIIPFVWDNGITQYGRDGFGLFDRKAGMKQAVPALLKAMRQGTKTAYP